MLGGILVPRLADRGRKLWHILAAPCSASFYGIATHAANLATHVATLPVLQGATNTFGTFGPHVPFDVVSRRCPTLQRVKGF
jgi:hypothetical protein